MSASNEEPTIESRRPFSGELVNLRVDIVRLPNGRLASREVVEHSDCVSVVPVDENGNVILVRQYRKPIEQFLLEVPAGGIVAGEDPKEAARRELSEETGYHATTLKELGRFWTSPGFCTEGMYAYLATGLTPGARRLDEDENIEQIEIPLCKVPSMIISGEICDGKSIVSLLLALEDDGEISSR